MLVTLTVLPLAENSNVREAQLPPDGRLARRQLAIIRFLLIGGTTEGSIAGT